MLEYKPERDGSGAQVSGAGSPQVVEAWDDGGRNFLRAPRGLEPVPSSEKVRHPVSDVRPVRESGAQHARAFERRIFG